MTNKSKILFDCFNVFNAFFRPPFINGRPQDSDSVFGENPLTPVFGEFSSVFFISIIFKKESPGVTRGHQESPGVTRGHQESSEGDWGRLGETIRVGTLRVDTVRVGTVRAGTDRVGTVRMATVRMGIVRVGTVRVDTVFTFIFMMITCCLTK